MLPLLYVFTWHIMPAVYCIAYCAIGRKPNPDRHPLPCIQNLIDTLGDHSWFSILDQGKAYHLWFNTKVSRHLAGFVTPWGSYKWVRIPLASPVCLRPLRGAWKGCWMHSGMNATFPIWTTSPVMPKPVRSILGVFTKFWITPASRIEAKAWKVWIVSVQLLKAKTPQTGADVGLLGFQSLCMNFSSM